MKTGPHKHHTYVAAFVQKSSPTYKQLTSYVGSNIN